jgi:hypothetical protein
MVDCVSASITIGGIVPPADLDDFIERIIDQELSLEWDGEPFTAADCITGQPLSLMTHDVPWGRFDALEAFCVERGLIFTRWCDGCRLWGPQLAVFHGQGKVMNYLAGDKGRCCSTGRRRAGWAVSMPSWHGSPMPNAPFRRW